MIQETLHQKWWKEMNVFYTFQFCKKMLVLSSNPYQYVSKDEFKEKCDKYVETLIDYKNQGILDDKISEIRELSPFPDDIRGVLHEYPEEEGIFQPEHLMYKLGVLEMGNIRFEFLIEYGILETDVEIYYGIKAISNGRCTNDDFGNKVYKMSKEWFDYMREQKTRIKPIDVKEHKFTNNVENGTFWISWLRMESKEEPKEVGQELLNVVKKLGVYIDWHFRKFLREKYKYKVPREMSRALQSKIDYTNENINSNIGANQEDNEKEDPIISRVEAACTLKDGNGKKLLSKKGKLYYFNCTNSEAVIFLNLLSYPKQFKKAYQIADNYVNKGQEVFCSECQSEVKKGWSDEIKKVKRKISRKQAMDIFRNSQGGRIEPSWFRTSKKFDDANDFNNIKKMVEEYNLIEWIDQMY